MHTLASDRLLFTTLLLLVIGLIAWVVLVLLISAGIGMWYQKRHEMQTHNASGISRHLIIKRLQGNAHSLSVNTLFMCAITITMLGSSVMLFNIIRIWFYVIPTTIVASGVGVDNVTDILKQAKVKPVSDDDSSSWFMLKFVSVIRLVKCVNAEGLLNVVALRGASAAKIQRELGPIRLHSQKAKLMLPTRSGFRPVGIDVIRTAIILLAVIHRYV